MPRDVRTRWNSTFDMLEFALKYRSVINAYTADRKNNLRQLELSEREWAIAEQLCNVLKVSVGTTTHNKRKLTPQLEGPQGRDPLLLSIHAESRHGDTGHGRDR